MATTLPKDTIGVRLTNKVLGQKAAKLLRTYKAAGRSPGPSASYGKRALRGSVRLGKGGVRLGIQTALFAGAESILDKIFDSEEVDLNSAMLQFKYGVGGLTKEKVEEMRSNGTLPPPTQEYQNYVEEFGEEGVNIDDIIEERIGEALPYDDRPEYMGAVEDVATLAAAAKIGPIAFGMQSAAEIAKRKAIRGGLSDAINSLNLDVGEARARTKLAEGYLNRFGEGFLGSALSERGMDFGGGEPRGLTVRQRNDYQGALQAWKELEANPDIGDRYVQAGRMGLADIIPGVIAQSALQAGDNFKPNQDSLEDADSYVRGLLRSSGVMTPDDERQFGYDVPAGYEDEPEQPLVRDEVPAGFNDAAQKDPDEEPETPASVPAGVADTPVPIEAAAPQNAKAPSAGNANTLYGRISSAMGGATNAAGSATNAVRDVINGQISSAKDNANNVVSNLISGLRLGSSAASPNVATSADASEEDWMEADKRAAAALGAGEEATQEMTAQESPGQAAPQPINAPMVGSRLGRSLTSRGLISVEGRGPGQIPGWQLGNYDAAGNLRPSDWNEATPGELEAAERTGRNFMEVRGARRKAYRDIYERMLPGTY